VIGAGFVLMWAGYAVGSYGWVLIKGYNITLRQWFSPLNPYQWPANTGATIPRVPKGNIFPTSSAASTSAGGGPSPAPPPNAI